MGGGRRHNWYILIPKWHLKAFCSAAKPALLEASDDINFSLFPEVCRKLKCRKCCGKKLKLCEKKRKIDRKWAFNRTACTERGCPLCCISTYAWGKIALTPTCSFVIGSSLPAGCRYVGLGWVFMGDCALALWIGSWITAGGQTSVKAKLLIHKSYVIHPIFIQLRRRKSKETFNSVILKPMIILLLDFPVSVFYFFF